MLKRKEIALRERVKLCMLRFLDGCTDRGRLVIFGAWHLQESDYTAQPPDRIGDRIDCTTGNNIKALSFKQERMVE